MCLLHGILYVCVNLTCGFSLMNEVVQTSPTIGSNVEEIIWKNIRFIMWDIGGQESLHNTWNSYFTNTKVCNFVVLFPILSELHWCNCGFCLFSGAPQCKYSMSFISSLLLIAVCLICNFLRICLHLHTFVAFTQ